MLDTDKIIKILIMILLLIIENFFYLFNKANFPISYNDLAFIVFILLVVFIIVKDKDLKLIIDRKNIFFLFIPLIIIILIFMSTFQAYFKVAQPLYLGIRPQRYLFSIIFLYPLIKLLKDEKMLLYMKKSLKLIGLSATFIYSIQYLFINKIKFLNIYETIRFGEVRLHFESIIIDITLFLIINELFKNRINKKERLIKLIEICTILFYYFFVIKGRLIVLGISITLIVLIYILKYKNKIIIIYISLYLLFGVFFIIHYEIKDNIIYNYYTNIMEEIFNNSGNYQIRNLGKNFYEERIKENPLLGYGFLNELYAGNEKILGLEYNYYLNDNGLTAIKVLYGYTGYILFIVIYLYLFLRSIKIIKFNIFYFSYFLYLGIISINILPSYWGVGPLIFTIIISLLYVDLEKLKFGKRLHKQSLSS